MISVNLFTEKRGDNISNSASVNLPHGSINIDRADLIDHGDKVAQQSNKMDTRDI